MVKTIRKHELDSFMNCSCYGELCEINYTKDSDKNCFHKQVKARMLSTNGNLERDRLGYIQTHKIH